jgi:hypothetical protein
MSSGTIARKIASRHRFVTTTVRDEPNVWIGPEGDILVFRPLLKAPGSAFRRLRTPDQAAYARTMRFVGFIALGALVGCAEPRTVCEIAENPDQFAGRQVRVEANGVFTRHGAYLQDAQCPALMLIWEESEGFQRSPQGDALSSAAFREQFGRFRDIRVRVSGIVETRPARKPRLIVDRLYSFSPVEGTERQRAPTDYNAQ